MMIKWIKSKKGVTLLEGLIALLLLALVATGTFSVILSVSRNKGADFREEMALAVENANNLLQAYIVSLENNKAAASTLFQSGPCGKNSTPLEAGFHGNELSCLLPPICGNNSVFSYEVDVVPANHFDAPSQKLVPQERLKQGVLNTNTDTATGYTDQYGWQNGYRITYHIVCNGFEL